VTIAVLALAIACAFRGMWSPCGLSMLSTITPLGERSRGHSYAWSMCLYGGSAAMALLGTHRAAGSILAAVAMITCLAGDAHLGGFRLPEHPRQVNERWLDRFRPWVYSSGFGWQIGTGVATYVMTDAIYALIAASVLTLAPSSALVVGIVFGFVRGACLLVGTTVSTPDSLKALHARMARFAQWSIAAPIGAELAILGYLAAGTGQPAVVVGCAVVGAAFAVAVLRKARAEATISLAAS
jgi:hypothetical protein